MTRATIVLRGLIQHFVAIALVVSFVLTTVLSVSHQTEFTGHSDTPIYEWNAHANNGLDPLAHAEDIVDIACTNSYFCHAPLVLFLDNDEADGLRTLSHHLRPDPGFMLRGQEIEVATPPPLNGHV